MGDTLGFLFRAKSILIVKRKVYFNIVGKMMTQGGSGDFKAEH